MRKGFILLLAAAATIGLSKKADAQVYGPGVSLVNLGIGLGATYGNGLPFGFSYDYGVTKNISVGLQVDYASWSNTVAPWGEYKYRNIPFGIRGAYHFDGIGDPAKVDVYLGLVAGYRVLIVSEPSGFKAYPGYSPAYAGGFHYGGIVGGRYMFTPGIGAFAELGYNVSYGKVGLTFKF